MQFYLLTQHPHSLTLSLSLSHVVVDVVLSHPHKPRDTHVFATAANYTGKWKIIPNSELKFIYYSYIYFLWFALKVPPWGPSSMDAVENQFVYLHSTGYINAGQQFVL